MPSENPVLDSIMPVIAELKYVSINYKNIEKLASKLKDKDLVLPEWREECFISNDDSRIIDYFFIGNSINFAYIDFDTHEQFETYYKGKKWSGSFAMFACLSRALERGIDILDPKLLQLIDRKTVRKIFTGNIEIPLLDERVEILHEIGKVLKEKYNGSFYNLAKRSEFYCFDNGNGIIEKLVKDFPSFNDISIFRDSNGKEHELKFYKRAQLSIAQTYTRLHNTNIFPIKDIDELTVFADYYIPASLRNFGILQYSKNLEEKINKGKLIEKDSREEQEIRASTLWSSYLLECEISRRGEKVNAVKIDYFLWKRKENKVHHLCRTIAY